MWQHLNMIIRNKLKKNVGLMYVETNELNDKNINLKVN